MKCGDLIDGRYRLSERLGQGGMSVVWRADDESLGREVAVKILSPALAGDPALRQRIQAEARAAAGLWHPGIVAVYDYGELTEAGQVLSYVVMELVEGRSLNDMLSGGPLAWPMAVLIGAEVAAALAAAHRAGIVHRDVKPGNVMVGAAGIKLVDFGISATVGELDGQDGMVLGTPAYLAPERIAGGPVRPATDVYALGLLLYRSLAGRLPWQVSTVTQMLKAHVYTSPAPLPTVDGLPGEVVGLLGRCLAKKPGERPSSAEIAQVLGEISGRREPEGARSLTFALRRPVLVGAAAATVLALSASWWTLGGDPSPAPQAASAATGSPAAPPPTTTTTTTVQATVVRQVVEHSDARVPATPTQAKPAGPALKLPTPPKLPKALKHPKPPKPRHGHP
ncbi:serine/threonine-protein kinase [Actinoplanes sp. NPDC020271]|uniref:serine/threonine-protein kinase n=1 Tax=Actinoplanes sp. NPDC020271 TaxID=3363896 RepID=UPI0037995C76